MLTNIIKLAFTTIALFSIPVFSQSQPLSNNATIQPNSFDVLLARINADSAGITQAIIFRQPVQDRQVENVVDRLRRVLNTRDLTTNVEDLYNQYFNLYFFYIRYYANLDQPNLDMIRVIMTQIGQLRWLPHAAEQYLVTFYQHQGSSVLQDYQMMRALEIILGREHRILTVIRNDLERRIPSVEQAPPSPMRDIETEMIRNFMGNDFEAARTLGTPPRTPIVIAAGC